MDRARGALLATAAIVVLIGCGGLALAAVKGTGKADQLVGTKGADVLNGRAGADKVRGNGGRDRLLGGKGADTLRGGKGRDEFNVDAEGRPAGGAGADRIEARDGTQDLIDCGAGKDTAVVDRTEDGLFDCETIKEPKG